jgi:hypothetical protein
MVGGFDPCLSFFFLIFLFFFFLFTGLLALELSPDKEDETEGNIAREEGEEDLTGEEGEGSTWGWCSWVGVHVTEALTAFRITWVENNHTGNPIVRPRRLKVVMWGGPMFP